MAKYYFTNKAVDDWPTSGNTLLKIGQSGKLTRITKR